MSYKRQDRAPQGAHGQAANESVPLFRCTQDPKLPLDQLVLYRLAGTTEYESGEPTELTRARDLVDSWCNYATAQTAHSLPIIPPRAVALAMRLRGWKVCQ
jgi:hypothetical protein